MGKPPLLVPRAPDNFSVPLFGSRAGGTNRRSGGGDGVAPSVVLRPNEPDFRKSVMAVFAEADLSEQHETATSGSQRGQRINYGMFSVKFCGTANPIAPDRVARARVFSLSLFHFPPSWLLAFASTGILTNNYCATTANRRLRRETEVRRQRRLTLRSPPFRRLPSKFVRAGVIDASGSNGGIFRGRNERRTRPPDGIMESNNASDVDRTRMNITAAAVVVVSVAVFAARGPGALTLYLRFDRQAARKTNQRRVVTDRACNPT